MTVIQDKLKILPNNSGCYLMKDETDKIIYVGKAKCLKNRVKSYFVGSHNGKTQKLIGDIRNFDFIVTSSELESLVLELNLIKKYDPKYNIRLKDDKTYPYIEITKELHPRLSVSRNPNLKRGIYFGPYPNVMAARETVELLNKLYPLRKCETPQKKECLYFHMHQCLGACISKERIDYKEYIGEISNFLKGQTKKITEELTTKMDRAALDLEFETAAEYRNMIQNIKTTTERQKMVMSQLIDADIIGYFVNNEDIAVYIFFMRQGKIINIHKEVFSYLGNPEEEIISYLGQFYQKNLLPKELWISLEELTLLSGLFNIKVYTPIKGEKKKLLDLANQNAMVDLETKSEIIRNKSEILSGKLSSLEETIGIKNLDRIEIFDNSNIQGVDPVSAMVVFEKGVKSPKEYRKYKIQTVLGPDDYKTTEEVIYRRYLKVLMENLKRPDLIIIDGGKGHVNVVRQTLERLNVNIPVIGLKKDDRHRTFSIIKDETEIILNSKIPCTKLLTEMQEEVHRFAITFHKKTRKTLAFASVLDDVPGIGEKRKQQILKKFKTIENMQNGTKEEYQEIGINQKLFQKIMFHLK